MTTLRMEVAKLSAGPTASSRSKSDFVLPRALGVDQHLVGVEAKPFAVEILRSVHAIRVMSAGLKALDIDVPEKPRLVVRRELDDLNWLDVVMLVEEQQFDTGGIAGKDREIHSLLIDRSTQWMRLAGLRLEGSLGFLLSNVGFTLWHGNDGCHRKFSG
jgi:hypothetical protein